MRQWKNLAFRSVDNCRKHIYLPPPTTPRLLGPIWTRIFEEFWNGGSLPSPPLAVGVNMAAPKFARSLLRPTWRMSRANDPEAGN